MAGEQSTVARQFAGYFIGSYDGQQDDEQGRADFNRLTNFNIMWTQVHGDVKNATKRALFVPYAHWKELHECCGMAVRAHAVNGDDYYGNLTCAKIMQTAMEILRKKYGLNAPKWWIPMMMELREDKAKPKRGGWNPNPY